MHIYIRILLAQGPHPDHEGAEIFAEDEITHISMYLYTYISVFF